MSEWPTGWREHALRHAEVPITQFALDILHHWEQSTPTGRYSNNPLGMPKHGYSSAGTLDGRYAAFPTMGAFYAAFKVSVHAGEGKPLFTALAVNDRHASAWRAINGLGWPANTTETDYPAHVLDQVTGAMPKGASGKPASARKSVGKPASRTGGNSSAVRQAEVLHEASIHIGDATRAINHIARGMGYGGR
jgi:hypothetical protein